MVNAADLKSAARKGLRVQVPSPALRGAIRKFADSAAQDREPCLIDRNLRADMMSVRLAKGAFRGMADSFRSVLGNRRAVTGTFLVSCFALGGTAGAAPAAFDPAGLYRAAAPSVVKVEAQVLSGFSQGSGVVVADGQIVTNGHVVEGSAGFVLIHQGRRTWRAEVERVDKDHDLALLGIVLRRGEAFGLPVARTRRLASVRIGERVFAIGTPQGLEQTLSDGLISGLPSTDTDTFIQTTAAISRGSSGGGLFDSKGLLLGITTLYLKEGQNLNFAVPADKVEALQKAAPARTGEYTFSPTVQPAAASTATPKRSDLPMPLGSIRCVVVSTSAGGPIASQGGVSTDWIKQRVMEKLTSVGIAAFASWDEERKGGSCGPLFSVEVNSMAIRDTVLYPWTLNVTLSDSSDFIDGSHGWGTTWQLLSHGYGGSNVVAGQVVDELDSIIDKFVVAAFQARTKENPSSANITPMSPVNWPTSPMGITSEGSLSSGYGDSIRRDCDVVRR
jgi:S1-C subfamily serine protease